MEILLAVLFNINGELAMVEGYYPHPQPNYDVCLKRKEFMEDYLPTVPDMWDIERIFCGTEEELEELIHMLKNSERA